MLFQKQIDYILDELEKRIFTVVGWDEPEEPPEESVVVIELTHASRLWFDTGEGKVRMLLAKAMGMQKCDPGYRFTALVDLVPVDSSCGDTLAWALRKGENDWSVKGYYIPKKYANKV